MPRACCPYRAKTKGKVEMPFRYVREDFFLARSRACKLIGYSRQQFYEIRRNFQTYGADGLIDRIPGAKGPHPNRVPAEI